MSGGAAIAGLGMTDLVIDAGVAIKWYIPEIHEMFSSVRL